MSITLDHDTWVIVADSEKALFLRNEGDDEHPNLEVIREMEQDNPPNREQAANRRGRVGNGGASMGHRSAVEDTDWHQMNKEQFAKDISEKLYELAHRGKFDKIIIAAAPLVLGEMRKEMHVAVTDKVVGELDKNLTNLPIHEIEEHLQAA
ncbi:MAG: host attachment family protein [Pseudomonadota bacterium]